jgi:CRP/FNR family transcriptional regulator, cyclic AMP receptor protein
MAIPNPDTEGSGLMNVTEARRIMCLAGWLKLCPDWFQSGLLEKSSALQFQRGERIHNSGPADSSGLWGIVEGTAGIGLDFPDRPDAVMHLVGPGFWGGAIELILGGERRAFLAAVTPVTALFVPASSFRVLSDARPEAWRYMAMLPTLNNAGAMRVVEDLLIQSAERRLAAVLLRLSGAARPDADGAVLIPLTQERIAEAANLSRTVAVAALSDLERAGAVERAYRAVRVFPDRLRALAMSAPTG